MTDNTAINYMGLNIGTLVIIAIGAVITIFAMIWGTMRRRAKAAAVAESIRHEHAIRDADAEEGQAAVRDAELPPEPSTIPFAPVAVPDAEAGMETGAETGPDLGAEPAVGGPSMDVYPLTTLKGLGPRAAAALAALGIAGISDLAALDPARAAAVDAQLGPLAGRIARDRWVEQAQLLAAGDITGFEASFGKLGG